jgi:predicted ATPase
MSSNPFFAVLFLGMGFNQLRMNPRLIPAVRSALRYVTMSGAQKIVEQAMALYDRQKHRSHAFVYGQDPGVACRSFAAWPIWVLGYPEQALRSANEALTLAQELTHPFSLAFALILA